MRDNVHQLMRSGGPSSKGTSSNLYLEPSGSTLWCSTVSVDIRVVS